MPVAAYGVERIVYILWSSVMLVMTTLQLATHYCQRTSSIARNGNGNGAHGTMMAGDRRHFIFGNYRVAAANHMNGRTSTFINGPTIAATLKLRYHQYTFGVSIWLAVMIPDPQSVYGLIPAGVWPIVIRNVEMLLLAYYITSQHSQLSLLYAPRPVPPSITNAMKMLCIAFAIMAIILPILQLAIGWQLFLVILIFMFDIISFIMPLLSWISLLRVRKLVTGLATYGVSLPQSHNGAAGNGTSIPSTNGLNNNNTNGVQTSPNVGNRHMPLALGSPPVTIQIGVAPLPAAATALPSFPGIPRKSDSMEGQRTPASLLTLGTPPQPVNIFLTTPQGGHTTTLVASAAIISSAAQLRAKQFRAALRRLTIGVIGTSVIFFAGIIYDALLLRQRLPHLFSPVESVSPDKYALPVAHFLLLIAESFLIWYAWQPLSQACGNKPTRVSNTKNNNNGNDKSINNGNGPPSPHPPNNNNGSTGGGMVTAAGGARYTARSGISSRGGTVDTAGGGGTAAPIVGRWMQGTPSHHAPNGTSSPSLPLLPPPLIITSSSPASILRQSIQHLPPTSPAGDTNQYTNLPLSGDGTTTAIAASAGASPLLSHHHLPSRGSSGVAPTTEAGGNDNDAAAAVYVPASPQMMIYDTSHLSHQHTSAEEFS